MWIPKSADEIERAVAGRSVEEGPTFDAKEALPAPGKNKDIAKDLAAMANDGGVLVYGIGEDDNKHATVLSPILLAGQAERIANVVHTGAAESPRIETLVHPTTEDPARGYLVVIVPASPRAPHMVTLEQDCRYYKRLDKISVRMNEGEIARLYERRQRWEVDRDALLDQAVARNHALWPPSLEDGDLHVMIRPVVPDDTMVERVTWAFPFQHFLYNLQLPVAAAYPPVFQPDLSVGSCQRRDAGWRCGSDPREEDRKRIVDLTITESGIGYLFCRRATDTHHREELEAGQKRLIIDLVAGLTTRALLVLGKLYTAAAYAGPVDVGVAVTGLKGFRIIPPKTDIFSSEPIRRSEDYRRTARRTAGELADDPRKIAAELVDRLVAQVGNG